MSRKRTGSVRLKRGKYLAEMAGEYLGSFDSEDDAWEAIAAAQLLDSDNPPDSLRAFAATFFAARRARGVRNIEDEQNRWRLHVEPARFIDWPMRRVRPRDIDSWLQELLAKSATRSVTSGGETRVIDTGRTLSRQTVQHARNLLLACFQYAAVRGKVTLNPVREVKMPRVKVAREIEGVDEIAFLQPEEVARLFAVIDATRDDERRLFRRAVYTVAIYQGLRQGEVWGLRWQDLELDGDRPTLRVRYSYAGEPKTPNARRRIPLQPAAVAALDAWRKRGNVTRATGLVFPSRHGGCYTPGHSAGWEDKPYTDRRRGRAVERVIPGLRGRARIRDGLTFHDLRHTCLTYLVHGLFGFARMDLQAVAQWAGHSDIKTTQRYVHALPSSLHDAIRRGSKENDTGHK